MVDGGVSERDPPVGVLEVLGFVLGPWTLGRGQGSADGTLRMSLAGTMDGAWDSRRAGHPCHPLGCLAPLYLWEPSDLGFLGGAVPAHLPTCQPARLA